MPSFKNIYRLLLLALLPAWLLTACVDDVLTPGGQGQELPDNGDGIYFSFGLGLNSLGSGTRANGLSDMEEYEDYIDPEKLDIMFYIKDNEDTYRLYKKFPPKSHYVSMIPVAFSTQGDYDKNYYVRIAVSEMPDGNDFAETLRTNDFKIAVMANGNQVLALEEQEKDDEGKITKPGDKINLIHHQTPRVASGTSTVSDGGSEEEESNGEETGNSDNTYEPYYNKYGGIYDFLFSNDIATNGKGLGYFTNWVTNINPEYDSEAKANVWLRTNWNPAGNTSLDYKYLYDLWNFGGADNSNAIKYTSNADGWETRNGKALRTWITEAGKGKSLGDFTTEDDGTTNSISKETEEDCLYFKTTEGVKAVIDEKEENGNTVKYYGVSLPYLTSLSGGGNAKDRLDEDRDKGFFRFKAHATGHLYITARHSGYKKHNTIKLVAQIGYSTNVQTFSFACVGKEGEKWNDDDVLGVQTLNKKISITGDAEYVYLYLYDKDKDPSKENDAEALKNALEIFQIEYVEDTYLNGVDRKGIAPSQTHPIEMYGMEEYEKLEGLWLPGQSFDLNNYNTVSPDYPYDPSKEPGQQHLYFHPIEMLRSVAKIEVLIPTALKGDHVFLRSANRFARWEPVDVSTPTSRSWEDNLTDVIETHNPECEFFKLMKNQSPFYSHSGASEDDQTQLSHYKSKLAWYYSDWGSDQSSAGIDSEAGESAGATVRTVGGVSVDGPADFYPHIINPLISRSDFVQFLKVEPKGIYDRYILYIGEKYVDDPDSKNLPKGIETASPKVCHIEFRLDGDPDYNLDDTNCYRIYFTTGGYWSGEGALGNYPNQKDNNNTWEKLYEENLQILSHHWHIMRNHCYTFTVKDVSSLGIICSLEVLPWKKVKNIEVDW
ncbi:MAG: hypothetical protein J1E82_08565 [Muribaculaceae bacterium]|nr:hypothetical protein [Muribaculaceae bacterium]